MFVLNVSFLFLLYNLSKIGEMIVRIMHFNSNNQEILTNTNSNHNKINNNSTNSSKWLFSRSNK